MKVAVIGSRELRIEDLERYLPSDTAEIISGGAKGIDNCKEKNIPVKAFLLKSNS